MDSVTNPHPFDKLISSTRNLHARFGTAQTVPLAILIASEEWREVQHEAYTGDTNALAHEAADLFVTVIGLCNLCGVTPEQLQEAMLTVAAKNDAKVPGVTHEIILTTRKIQKIRRDK